jgi:hypothetical protein
MWLMIADDGPSNDSFQRLAEQLTRQIKALHGEGAMKETIVQVAPAPYVTVRLAASITGLTEKAIRRKIQEGKWIEGREFRRSPDGGIFISLKGYQQWVERG